ncbi:MAG: DHH family phosphoesterase [Hadesarchaea archaeon]|nr:MAG: DHH family phosphoesterase [Hadesarchaea archaeon]
MLTVARKAAELIKTHRNDSIQIISHMDADGVCAAAVISKALDRNNIEHHTKFVRMLYREVVEELEPTDLTIFTDLGSSQLQNVHNRFSGHDVIIADHHKPERVEGWRELVHFNAHQFGLDGAQEVSGAGMAYIIARELDQANRDLSGLAIVGALGDIQDAWGKLLGYNRQIAKDSIDSKVLEQKIDLMFYGRHTRPIFKALETFTDPPIPGVSNSAPGCVSLLKDLDIPFKSDGRWRRPIDLTDLEKRRLATELIARAYTAVPKELVQYVPGLIIGEAHTLLKEDERSMLRGADEFSTCINSTARHEQPLIGFEVAKGDRRTYCRAMLNLLRYHRRCIAEGMEFIEQSGLERGRRGYLQYFDATGKIKETFIGTIASLTLGHPACDPYKPMMGIIRKDGVAKISARCSKLLFLKGLDMARAIRDAARLVGGEGGGHAVACGAQVEENRIPEFLERFENLIIEQLG